MRRVGGPARVAEFSQASLEQTPLAVVVREIDRAAVGGAGVVASAHAAQQFGAGRM
jgi:hypothetical protein